MTIHHAFTAIGAAIEEVETALGDVTGVTTDDGHVLIDDTVSLNCTVALPVIEPSSAVELDVREATLQTNGTLMLDLAISAPVSDDEHDPSDSDGEERVGVVEVEPAGASVTNEGSVAPPDAESDVDSDPNTPKESEPPSDHESAPTTASDPVQADSVPAYKDPEQLRTVYDECETFVEMTAALGVDVTSETVRTRMVNHGIHEPRSAQRSESSSASSTPSLDTEPDEVRDDDTESVPSTSGTDDASKGDLESETTEETPQQVSAGTKANGDTEIEAIGNETGTVEGEIDADANEDPIVVPDGIGLPAEVDCADLAAVVSRASTVYEVHQQLECNCDQAQLRQLLCDLGVLDLVTGRIATQATRNVPPEEVVTRIQHSLATGT